MSWKKMPLHWKIIIGLVLGVGWALLSSALGWSQFTIDWIDPWGTIFIRLLKLIAVPLVLFSIIAGIAGLTNVSKLGRMGVKTLLMYLVTTVMAVGIGLVLVNLLNPGSYIAEDQRMENRVEYELWVQQTEGVELLDGTCVTCKTDAESQAMVARVTEKLRVKEVDPSIMAKLQTAEQTKDKGPLQFVVDMVPDNLFISLSNNKLMLQIIFFAIFFGITLVLLPKDKTKSVIDFVNGANEVFLKMVELIMKAAPFFVFALLAGVVSKMAGDDPGKVVEIFKGLTSYSIVVVLGLGLMIFVFYPLIIRMLAKIPYFKFFKGIGPAQMLAFSTSSSAATLPVTMECVEDNLGVSRNVTSFVLPIGATVNMDGTSLYQAIAVVFLAQMHMVDLTLGQQLTIVFTATLASIGSAAVPSAGLVMMIIVLQSVGLNPAWIAIIFPVDRILDMCRTVVNVTGDATVSSVIAHSENELHPPQ